MAQIRVILTHMQSVCTCTLYVYRYQAFSPPPPQRAQRMLYIQHVRTSTSHNKALILYYLRQHYRKVMYSNLFSRKFVYCSFHFSEPTCERNLKLCSRLIQFLSAHQNLKFHEVHSDTQSQGIAGDILFGMSW